MSKSRVMSLLFCSMATLSAAGCGGWTPATVSGTVSGMTSGTSVVLAINGKEALRVAANGPFKFDSELDPNTTYSVTVVGQPVGETCFVANGAGTISSSGADVSNVTVTCLANVTVSGTVTGLSSGQSVGLHDNATDPLVVTANGAFSFPTALSNGAPYNVTVATQPLAETCTVSNGSGIVDSSHPTNATNVLVTCTLNPW